MKPCVRMEVQTQEVRQGLEFDISEAEARDLLRLLDEDASSYLIILKIQRGKAQLIATSHK